MHFKQWSRLGNRPVFSNGISSEKAVELLKKNINESGSMHLYSAAKGILFQVFIPVLFFGFLFLPILIVFGVAAWVGLLLIPSTIYIFLKFRLKSSNNEKGLYVGKSYERYVLSYINYESNSTIHESMKMMLKGVYGNYNIDLSSEPNNHILILGSSSSGKTTTLKSVLGRASLLYNIYFLAIDWQGELEEFAKESGSCLWKVPDNLQINIFKLNNISKAERAGMIEEAMMLSLHLTQLQATRVRDALAKLYENSEPTLQMLWDELKQRKENYLIGYRIKAVERVIGTEPDEFWENIFSNNTVLSLAGLNDNEKSIVAYFVLQRICELFESKKSNKNKLLIAMDEAWQLMNKRNDSIKSQGAHEVLAERIVRLGRKYGFGIITSTQQIEDIPSAFINSSSVIMLHNYRQGWKNNLLGLNVLDIEYAKSAGLGECLVMDRGRSMQGQTWLDYVKVMALDRNEMDELIKYSTGKKPVQINSIKESKINLNNIYVHANANKSSIKIPLNAPTPAEHAALLAVLLNGNSSKRIITKFIKEKRWIKSDATLYGYKGNLGILKKIVSKEYAKESNKKYILTDLGRKWVDPEQIIINQSGKIGSEEHKALMVKTIKKLHEDNELVITSSTKHMPDIIAWPVNRNKSYLWDYENVKGYEAQTSARNDSVSENMVKQERLNLKIVWVSSNEEVIEQIKKIVSNGEFMIV